jgi:hypothetical protein
MESFGRNMGGTDWDLFKRAMVAFRLAELNTPEVMAAVGGDGGLALLKDALPDVVDFSVEVVKVIDQVIAKAKMVVKWKDRMRQGIHPLLADTLAVYGENVEKKKAAVEDPEQDTHGQKVWTPRMVKRRRLTRGPTPVEELKARDKVEMDGLLPRVVQVLGLMDASSLREAEAADNKDLAVRGLLGGARVATVRLREKAAEAMVRWMKVVKGIDWPGKPTDIVDYLWARQQEENRTSFPKSLLSMIRWFEARAGQAAGESLSESDLLKKNMEMARAQAEEGSRVTKAPRFLTAMLGPWSLGSWTWSCPQCCAWCFGPGW